MMDSNFVDITIPVPWGIISGKTYGESRSPPVLCVHGRNDNLESFSSLMPMLPPNYYYVFIDLPGHGKSSHADKGYILDIPWYTMTVKRVIMHFKWPTCYYLGHSLGAMIGFLLAATFPDVVLKLIIIDALMLSNVPQYSEGAHLKNKIFEPLFDLENKNLESAPVYSLNEFVERMKKSRKTVVSDSQMKKMANRNLIMVGSNQYKFTNDQRNKLSGSFYYSSDQVKHLASEISCHTLVILGINSTVTYPSKLLNHSPLHYVKNITFHTIDGDHDVHMNHPDLVAKLVVPFLTEGRISKL